MLKPVSLLSIFLYVSFLALSWSWTYMILYARAKSFPPLNCKVHEGRVLPVLFTASFWTDAHPCISALLSLWVTEAQNCYLAPHCCFNERLCRFPELPFFRKRMDLGKLLSSANWYSLAAGNEFLSSLNWRTYKSPEERKSLLKWGLVRTFPWPWAIVNYPYMQMR